MKALLDTHCLIWWLVDDPLLSKRVRREISLTSNRLYVSAASAWEIAIKVRAGKLNVPEDLLTDFSGTFEREGFDCFFRSDGPTKAPHCFAGQSNGAAFTVW